METQIYTANSTAGNAEEALLYWERHPDLSIFAGARGGYAVAPDNRACLFQAPGWRQTSPEEIETYLKTM